VLEKSLLAVLRAFRRRFFRSTLALGMAAAAPLIAGAPFAKSQTPSPPKRSEIQRVLPITKFYDTPNPPPAGKPGELIRSEEFDQYYLPFSVSAVRILYHSRSATGEDVVSSGVVLTPSEGNPPAGGWPVIVFAHGASGVARPCAPSLMRNVGHGPILSMYVSLGYAVVATDYTGLGTNFRNAFLDGLSNATDVINSVPAARAALPQLSKRWIVVGEAEGGLTAVAVAEQENEIRDPGYLGAMVISNIASAREIYEPLPSASGLMLTALAYGIKTVYPQFQVSDMLTEKGLALYRNLEQMCSQESTMPELSAMQTVKPGWDKNAFVVQYFERSVVGRTRAYGPIMVIGSDADQAKVASRTSPVIAALCKQGDRVQWQRYSDLAPGNLIGDSVPGQISWMEARFAGRPVTSECR